MILSKKEYLEALTASKYKKTESVISDVERKSFLFTAINRQKVLSSFNKDSDVDFYNRTVYYQNWRQIDQQTEFNILLENIKACGDTSFLHETDKGPFIFCGFHYGAYNLIPFMLKKLGVDFVTVAVEENMIEDLVQFQRDAETKDFSKESDTIKSGGFQVLLQMLQALKSGKNILVFIDGGNGTTKVNDKEKLTRVSFLEEKIFTRTGVLELAYKMNSGIIPIVAKREEDKSASISFSPRILPDKNLPRKEAIKSCAGGIYAELEPFVREDPAQWEVWELLHLIIAEDEEHSYLKYWENFKKKFRPKKLLTSRTDLYFNQKEYGFYKEDSSYFIIHKFSLEKFKISLLTYNVLKSMEIEKSTISDLRKLLPIEVLSKILKKRVFIPLKQ